MEGLRVEETIPDDVGLTYTKRTVTKNSSYSKTKSRITYQTEVNKPLIMHCSYTD